ncbi:MAG: helix-turn-helix domain-containing protein [Elusimicrobiales bacterium]
MLPQLVSERGIPLAELSRRTGLTYKTVIKLYYSDFTSLRVDTLDKLCQALEAQPGDFLKYEPGPATEKPAPGVPTPPLHPRNKRAKRSRKRGKEVRRP